MRAFLQTYVKKFYQSTATSQDFTDTFDQFLTTLSNGKEIAGQIDWQAWIYGSGSLPIDQDFSTPVVTEAQSLAAGYEQLGGGGSPENFEDMKNFNSLTNLVFLDKLRDDYDSVTP